jgi:hypothetical protein
VGDQYYDAFFAERRAFLGHLGEPVFFEDFSDFGFDMVVFIFSSGVEGELALGRASGFDHIHSGPFEIQVDKEGIPEACVFSLAPAVSGGAEGDAAVAYILVLARSLGVQQGDGTR